MLGSQYSIGGGGADLFVISDAMASILLVHVILMSLFYQTALQVLFVC